MKFNSDELGEYIRAVLEGIGRGISEEVSIADESETFSLSGPVRFRIDVVNAEEIRGEAKIWVAGVHAGRSKGENSTIEFEVNQSSANFLSDLDKVVTIWGKLPEKDREAIKSAVTGFAQRLQLDVQEPSLGTEATSR